MRTLSTELRRRLESAVLDGRHAAEAGARAALATLGVHQDKKPAHLTDDQARLRIALRAKQRQLGSDPNLLTWDAAYEQWHRLLFARFLAENGLLRHPDYDIPITLAECEELAPELGEPDGWAVATRFAAQILPGIFKLADPCVQLQLAPEHRAALETIVSDLPSQIFTADDSLGWVYQYWQSERKDQVNASETKIGGADLGPVTQLFTEHYMVRFLLENSLGAWWAARHPESPLITTFEYLRYNDDGTPAAGTFDTWPDKIAHVTVMDPCCGSGHFLTEAFTMLWHMRAEEEGLDPIQAQDAVLQDNLYGLELDPRCVQIAMFNVALTAWKQGNGWRNLPTPNIACSGIPAKAPLTEWTALAHGDDRLEHALQRLHTLFKNADTLGSLIDPRSATQQDPSNPQQGSLTDIDFNTVAPLLEQAAQQETNDPTTTVLGTNAAGIARAANLLSRNYTLITTNVPYVGFGKQSDTLASHVSRFHGIAALDLATAFLHRFATGWSSSYAAVTPQNWLFLAGYEDLRRWAVSTASLLLVARLGAGAFSEITGEVVNVALVIGASRSSGSMAIYLLDAAVAGAVERKAAALRRHGLTPIATQSVLSLPGAVVPTGPLPSAPPLGAYCRLFEGTKPGQTARVTRYFWEVRLGGFWRRLQSSPSGDAPYSGSMKAIANPEWLSQEIPQSNTAGQEAAGKPGVLVAKIGDLPASLLARALFDNNTYALIPHRGSDLPALWAFCESGEFSALARRINQKLDIAQGAVAAVPFDVDYWRKVAAEKYPNGLPEPHSNDPTQWLFNGQPEEATQPLQVAVARLLNYHWPEQDQDDDLSSFADEDGIACLPAVRGEAPAADRLQTLLAHAYGDAWTPSLIPQLLDQAGSRKKTLTDWLRDDFFKHHCKTFNNRPFIWHIWDGRKDGFAALLNYHQLNRANLEKLTYTYLGDWIERQQADARDNTPGADLRLAAAEKLKTKLEATLKGEPPYDIYIRWKPLHQQPIGWNPNLDDGVRLNIRPFVKAGILRSRFTIHWNKDRGKNPDGTQRHNDKHYTRQEKLRARNAAGE